MTTNNDPTIQPIRRRRGGQPGNANRLKHGLYAQPSLPFEHRDPLSVPVTDLQVEIDTYQQFIHQYGQAALRTGFNDLETARLSLLTIAYASNQLATLVRIQARARLFTSTTQEFEAWLASLPSPEEENGNPTST